MTDEDEAHVATYTAIQGEYMTEALGAVLQECEQKGMVLPFILVAVGRNGSVLVLRVPGGGSEGELLAEHDEDEGFRTPITCMVVDQTGEAVRITIQAEEVTYH